MTFYTLRNRVPVPTNDVLEWARFFETRDRIVAVDYIGGERISTVFIGTGGTLFETIRFGETEESAYVGRYSTWEKAERGHREIIQKLKEQLAASGLP